MSKRNDSAHCRDLWNRKMIDALTYAVKHPNIEATINGDRVLNEQMKKVKSVKVYADGFSLDIPSLEIKGISKNDDIKTSVWNQRDMLSYQEGFEDIQFNIPNEIKSTMNAEYHCKEHREVLSTILLKPIEKTSEDKSLGIYNTKLELNYGVSSNTWGQVCWISSIQVA